jgi:hypothetical protein
MSKLRLVKPEPGMRGYTHDECLVCLQPGEFCECASQPARLAEQSAEYAMLREAADRAIKRGFVQLTKRRSLWARLRDAWWAFWHGLS